MQVTSAWVQAPAQVGGLDHLAVQAPCINIYGRVLPGITNVTDRARYYSFYPWLIWALDKAGFTRYDDDFIERFRRADCLFSLIAERHAKSAGGNRDDHAAAMVGSNTLASVAVKLEPGTSVSLSQYSLREGAEARYFLNRLGGLGQYYLGVLRELKALDGDASRGIKYTAEVGEKIAEAIDAGVDRELFLKVVDLDRVSFEELEELSGFCPCQLVHNLVEQSMLIDMFFVRGEFYDPDALQRRWTLQLMLHLADSLASEGEELSETTFKAAVYTGSLPSSAPWQTPSLLQSTKQMWAIYAKNELLSLAVQGLFYALLDSYEDAGIRVESSSQLVDWYLDQPEAIAALTSLEQGAFAEVVRQSGTWLPPIEDWRNPLHEVSLTEQIAQLTRGPKSVECRKLITQAAMRALVALAGRTGSQLNQYGSVEFDKGFFDYYPANLQSFAAHAKGNWAGMMPRQLLEWLLMNWGVGLHLRVGFRKLRAQSQSTFRIRPSDAGLEIIAVPPAVHTRPRFNQAVRVLRDLGTLQMGEGKTSVPTLLGRSMMELGDDH